MKKQIILLFLFCVFVLGGRVSASDTQEHAFDETSFQEILHKEKGRPLIVNFWSYDCVPCLAEMAEFDHFTQQHDDVMLTLVSTDPWDQMKRIRRTLAKYGPQRFESWVFAHAFIEKIRFSVDRKWRGQLPLTYLVDPDGTRHSLTGAVDGDRLDQWYKGFSK